MTPLQKLVKQLIKKYNTSTNLRYWGAYGILQKAKDIKGIKEEGWRMFFSEEICKKFRIPNIQSSIDGMNISSADSIRENFRQISNVTGVNFV